MRAIGIVLLCVLAYTALCGLMFDHMFKRIDKECQTQLDEETVKWLEQLQYNEANYELHNTDTRNLGKPA